MGPVVGEMYCAVFPFVSSSAGSREGKEGRGGHTNKFPKPPPFPYETDSHAFFSVQCCFEAVFVSQGENLGFC